MRLGLVLLLVLLAGCSGSHETEPVLTLGNPVDVDRQPSWNPNATAIVYRHGENHIRIIDFGSGTITDVGDGYDPAWSPDGHTIAYAAADGIRIYDAATGQDTVLYSNGPLYGEPRAPAWSSDSQWLAFDVPPDTLASGPHVMAMHVADGTRVRLGNEFAMQPCWMPGDSTLVVAGRTPDGNENLAILGLDGQVRRQLTEGDYVDRTPAISRDGLRIAWLGMARHGQPSGIFSMPLAGGTRTLLAYRGQDPTWSPDGSTIVYAGYDSGNETYTLWSMRWDGSDKVRMTAP